MFHHKWLQKKREASGIVVSGPSNLLKYAHFYIFFCSLQLGNYALSDLLVFTCDDINWINLLKSLDFDYLIHTYTIGYI